jgi:hypothetical protein
MGLRRKEIASEVVLKLKKIRKSFVKNLTNTKKVFVFFILTTYSLMIGANKLIMHFQKNRK